MHAGNPKLLFRVPHPFPHSLRKGWAPVSRRRNRFSSEHSIGQKGAAWKETILYSLPTAKQGYLPNGGLVFDSAGDLYAATISCSLFSIFYAEMKVFLNLSSAPECVRRPGRGVNLINPKNGTELGLRPDEVSSTTWSVQRLRDPLSGFGRRGSWGRRGARCRRSGLFGNQRRRPVKRRLHRVWQFVRVRQ
jgi:hypothetical protein